MANRLDKHIHLPLLARHLMPQRHVIALVFPHRQRNPDQPGRHLIEASGFSVKGDHFSRFQSRGQFVQLRLIADNHRLNNLMGLDDPSIVAVHQSIHAMQSVAQAPKFKFSENIIDWLEFKILSDAGLQIKLNVKVAHNRRQPLTQKGHLAASGQPVANARANLIQMLINNFQAAIFLHEFRRRFLANASHARDIIRTVPHQGFEVD